MISFELVENLLLDLINIGSGSISGVNDLDYTFFCRRRSVFFIDFFFIYSVIDQEKIINYEIVFGFDNRIVIRVYYINGVVMDYSKEEEVEVFVAIEIYFESLELL